MRKSPEPEAATKTHASQEQSQRSHADAAPPLAPEDFYHEGSNLVFTAAYHRKRGSCCNSGCRHCPFGDASKEG